MNLHINRIIYTLATVLTIVLHSCVTGTTDSKYVSVSILPQKYVVEQLLGDSTQVNVLIPKGSSPATYAPSPAQIKNLSQSSLYLRIGHIGFEQAWTKRISEINPDLKIVDTSSGISYLRGEDYVHGDHVHKGGIDPHVWTSPKTMLSVVINTKEALIMAFPNKKETIISNAKILNAKIEELDQAFNNKCNSLPNKTFFIFHPAYTYLAQDYGLEQVSIEHKGKEPSAKWLQHIITEGRDKNIKAIFIQEEFDKRNAELICSELNIPSIQVNPLSEKWDEEMIILLNKLEETLN